MIPDRITAQLLTMLSGTRLEVLVVMHAEHDNEIDKAVRDACKKLRNAGSTVLIRSVLSHGVNNPTGALIDLSRQLFSAQVLPCYLHLPDNVRGTAHFAINRSEAILMAQEMASGLPGYLVPGLVTEEPGRSSKTPVL